MAGENTKVRLPQGGDRLEVDATNGGKITPGNGTQASAIADVATAGSATAAANATAINSILAALRGVGIIAAA